MFSFVGDTVLDPFLGTGTTSVAAAKWGRNSIGVEVDPHYFEMAQARIQQRNFRVISRRLGDRSVSLQNFDLEVRLSSFGVPGRYRRSDKDLHPEYVIMATARR